MKRFWIATIIVLISLAAFFGFAISITSRLLLLDMFFNLTPMAPSIQETNILLLGLDGLNDNCGHRSDTIMVLHVNSERKTASLVSIPRDTLVYIPGRGFDKINAAYAYGGIGLSRKTVEDFLHINIPYYVIIDFAGAEEIIDKLGGITLNVEKRMRYSDRAGNLDIDLQPGVHKLNGKQVIGYLRFRHTDNDFARIGRQQKFLYELAAQLMRRGNILNLPSLYFSLLNCVNTNLNSREVLRFLLAMREAVELGQVNMAMIPGTDLMVDGIYYCKPNETETQKIVSQYLTNKIVTALNSETPQN